jgi:hypothetical protein
MLSINPSRPGAMPPDARDLLQRFGLSSATLLTTDRQSPKLSKGQALGRSVILYTLPAASLGEAINPDNSAGGPRSFVPSLFALAEAHGLTQAARAHNGCPWATQGCGGAGGACLAWSGHAGMGSPENNPIVAARGRRTLARLADPEAFGRAVFWSVLRHLLRARRDALPLAVRLRGTDDYPWHRHAVPVSEAEAQAIAARYGVDVIPGVETMAARLAALPELRPYEYSAAPVEGPLGLIAQRDGGPVDVTSSFKPDAPTPCRRGIDSLRQGFRLAVPVRINRGDPLPTHFTLTTGGESITVPTVDGDAGGDHRWADPHGVAVLLRLKTVRSAGPEADAFSLAAHGLPQHLADGLAMLTWEG